MKVNPPKKKPGQGIGPRRLNGAIRDVASVADWLGVTEHKIRSAVDRGMVPHRKWGGRLIFITDEIETFLRQLPGVTPQEALTNLAVRKGEADT